MHDNIPEKQLNELSEKLAAGNKIGAIKQYRALTGLSLSEAKREIETLEGELHKKFPEKFAAPKKPTGCLGAAAAFSIVGMVLIYWAFGA